MNENFYFDLVSQMHTKFGITKVTDGFDQDTFDKLMKFRAEMMKEEIQEFEDALEDRNPEEVIDALLDLIVFAFGTADMIIDGPSFMKAYYKVMEANFKKQVGIKKGRPNPLGLPDLLKPKGWKNPDLSGLNKSVDKRLRGVVE